MSPFYLGLIIGLFVGANMGFVVLALCNIASTGDDNAPPPPNGQKYMKHCPVCKMYLFKDGAQYICVLCGSSFSPDDLNQSKKPGPGKITGIKNRK